MRTLSLVSNGPTRARIVANIYDLTNKDLGNTGTVEEKKYGDGKLTFIIDCKNSRAVSILVRVGTEHVVDELERGLRDSLSVVKVAPEDGKMTAGGGAAATAIAMAL